MTRVLMTVAAILLVFATGPTRAWAEASRVRILLVLDTKGNADLKKRRAQTLAKMKAGLGRAFRRAGLQQRYTLDVLAGSHVTPEQVLRYYKRLRTGPSETLVFYGNMHGATDPQRGPFFKVGSGRLYRADLREALLARRPRLAVLLTDACANFLRDGSPRKGPPPVHLPGPARYPSGRWTNPVRDLFFRHRGVVDVNATRVGLSSWGHPRHGNYFSVAFAELLNRPVARFDRNRNGFVEWREFYRVLERQTRHITRVNRLRQQPQAYSLGQRAS
jgi:hypothetical protein